MHVTKYVTTEDRYYVVDNETGRTLPTTYLPEDKYFARAHAYNLNKAQYGEAKADELLNAY